MTVTPTIPNRRITRHYLTVGQGARMRRVHYRRCGEGPPLLMVHQSPRSSAEYAELMRIWGAYFTCIAPDTPGFGQSDPLHEMEPEIGDYAAALGEFVEALGIAPTLAYGFHSGGIILVTALKSRPDLFRALAIGGYAIWTPQEMAVFGASYLPPFRPAPYGEHLAWLWHRILEQSWFFPWFDLRDETRLPGAHADPMRVQAVVMEMLDAGDHYRSGYGAVLRAPRDIPVAGAEVPPCLITAYDGDPLQPHIDRLGEMPRGWEARKVATADDHQAESLAFLQGHAGAAVADLAEDRDAGWIALDHGLVHWRGNRSADRLVLHCPAKELADPGPDTLAIDVPGHGLSDDAENMVDAIEAAAEALGATDIAWPSAPQGEPAQLYPDLAPDRFGTHLHKAWGAARAEAMFAPWYAADRDHAIPVDAAALAPDSIAQRTRARLRAGTAARRWHRVLAERMP